MEPTTTDTVPKNRLSPANDLGYKKNHPPNIILREKIHHLQVFRRSLGPIKSYQKILALFSPTYQVSAMPMINFKEFRPRVSSNQFEPPGSATCFWNSSDKNGPPKKRCSKIHGGSRSTSTRVWLLGPVVWLRSASRAFFRPSMIGAKRFPRHWSFGAQCRF